MRWLPMISGQASHPRSVGCFVFQVFCSAFHLFGGGTMEHHRGPRNSAIRTPQNPVIVMVLRFRVLACLVLPCVSCVSCVTYAAPLCKYDFPPLTITLNELHQNSLTYGGRGGVGCPLRLPCNSATPPPCSTYVQCLRIFLVYFSVRGLF